MAVAATGGQVAMNRNKHLAYLAVILALLVYIIGLYNSDLMRPCAVIDEVNEIHFEWAEPERPSNSSSTR